MSGPPDRRDDRPTGEGEAATAAHAKVSPVEWAAAVKRRKTGTALPGDDAIIEGYDDRLCDAWVEEIREKAPEVDDRPEHQVRKGEGHRAVAAALEALRGMPNTFQRDCRLVSVVDWNSSNEKRDTTERPDGAPVVRDVSAPALWERLSAAVKWTKYDGRAKKNVPSDPPHDVVAAVLQRGDWPGLRELRGVITAPALRPDGTLIDKPGYDSATGLYFAPTGKTPSISPSPTRADALAARDALLEVVCDFPFASEAHRAAWLASLLTPFARPAIGDANAPLFLVDGNSRGCGKSRLVDCAAIIATGRTAPRQQYTANGEELDKRIVSHLQAADSLILFDNVAGDFGGPVLDKLLTSEGWYAARLLGKNSADAALKLRNRATWFATANNASLAGDLVRRVVHIRLATELERPEERSDFRHSDLFGWIRSERPRLIAAALTVLRAWFVAQRPLPEGLAAFGSFEAWSAIVRGTCLWVGLPDPWGDTREGLREADPGDTLHDALIAGIEAIDCDGAGLSTGEIKRRLESASPQLAGFLDALAAAGFVEDGKVDARKLGRRLQLLKGKRKAGAWIAAERDSHSKAPVWRIARELDESRDEPRPSAGVHAEQPAAWHSTGAEEGIRI